MSLLQNNLGSDLFTQLTRYDIRNESKVHTIIPVLISNMENIRKTKSDYRSAHKLNENTNVKLKLN